eukprot:gnl/TRDRNA2_/TRDRNA2_195759_c0_seq1.p1 gnl/TRDRNA2_/TRDRNA2_195759_c0~~gnl/TRDRNA2_/TRDRNA2_195759_c0_seq1.p1  ORF type:complete len:218 (-),score=29.71 gnl/TRDRNA2_/TRDRNA2_195759_c0_seq1:358-960(-)
MGGRTQAIVLLLATATGAALVLVAGESTKTTSETKPGTTPPPTTVTTAAAAIVIVCGIIKAARKKNVLSTAAIYLGNLIEAGIWSMLYCFFGFSAGHLPEHLFPPFDPKHDYWWPQLMIELCLQAGVSAIIAQVVRDLVHSLPVPDIGHDAKPITDSGGGIIFASIMFARQANFKNKLAALVKLFEYDFHLHRHITGLFG